MSAEPGMGGSTLGSDEITPTEITLERTKGPALLFYGYAMKRVLGDPSGTRHGVRRHELNLYRVLRLGGDGDQSYEGGYAIGVEFSSTFNDDITQRQAYLATTSEDVWRWLAGHNPRADVKLASGGFAGKHRDRIYREVTERFQDAAHRLMSAFPELGERTLGMHWCCDVCGEAVSIAEGWVEWRAHMGEQRGSGLRLVHATTDHRQGCQYDDDPRSEYVCGGDHLVEFLGPDGLMALMGLITDEVCPISEVIDMIKRLHVPRYESARPYFEQATRDGIVDIDLPHGSYSQDMLSEIIARYS